MERPRLAQLLCEENHRVLWEEAKILETAKNSVYRKYQEETYVACLQKKERKKKKKRIDLSESF